MNLKEIRAIIDLMNENELTEIELEREGGKLKLKKGYGGEIIHHSAPPISMPVHVAAAGSSSSLGSSDTKASNPNHKEIASPMVGTFYSSPSPESPSFVEVGQTVEVGQVVCIVEAMKLMNEIKSEVKGKVVEVRVENAQPVEFGQVLFTVEPI